MKRSFLTTSALPVLAVVFLFFSCSKNELSTPPASQQATSAQLSEESVTVNPDSIAGLYRVTKFTRDGKNETSRFTGYRFNFRADSVLLARTNSGQVVQGTWTVDYDGIMQIDISGTGALDKLVGKWEIRNLTSTQFTIINDEGSRVIFTRLGS